MHRAALRLASRARGALLFASGLLVAGNPQLAGSIELPAASMAVSGDSISTGFDTGICDFGDHPERAWATGVDHGAMLCAAGPTGTFSHAERLGCSRNMAVAALDQAIAGDSVVVGITGTALGQIGFAAQAANVRAFLGAEPAPRYAAVLLGHNDANTASLSKSNASCPAPAADRDPNDYCRASASAFEREVRAGLDQLIQIPSVRILVLATLRFSQLCDFGAMPSNGGGTCSAYWPTFPAFQSLISDCSVPRQVDMLASLRTYNQILAQVTGEYDAIPAGGASGSGAVKASDVSLRFSWAPFYLRWTNGDVSACDCLHPSDQLQAKLADVAWRGLECTPGSPCCADTGDPAADAACAPADTTSFYPSGGFACASPTECDDGDTCTADACTADAVCTHTPNGSCASTTTTTSTVPTSSTTTTTIQPASVCGATPLATCKIALARKALLKITRSPAPARSRLAWKWVATDGLAVSDVGDPSSNTDYELCVYDQRGLLAGVRAPHGGGCPDRPCWSQDATRVTYRDPELTPDGMQAVTFRLGLSARGRIALRAKGSLLVPLPLPLLAPVRVQLVQGEGTACFDASYTMPTRNTGATFKAKSD